MVARTRQKLMWMSGEELLLLRILWGNMVRLDVDLEIDRRAGMKPTAYAVCKGRPIKMLRDRLFTWEKYHVI